MTTRLMFEPTDPPTRPVIPVDRETFDAVVTTHGLSYEYDGAARCVYVVWEADGQTIEFVAPSVDVAS